MKNFSGLVGTNAADQIAGQGLMKARTEALPGDVEALQAALIVARVEAAAALTRQSDDQAQIAYLKLQVEKLNRDRYGHGPSAPHGFWISLS